MYKNPRVSFVVYFCIATQVAYAEFTPGHVFVSEFADKQCRAPFSDHGDRIWEINPETGEVSLFAELEGDWCGGAIALVFTPDGQRLRVAQFLRDRIVELDSNGTPSVLYHAAVGIGRSSMTFDRAGNFYVSGYDRITIFSPGADAGKIYADYISDPLIERGGSLAVGIKGDLYFAGLAGGGDPGRILQFDGPHDESLFESIPFEDGEPTVITSDSCGDLYLSTDYGKFFKYVSGDASTKTLLTQFAYVILIALDPSHTYVYITTDGLRKLFRYSLADDSIVEIADLPSLAAGMAVAPVANPPYGLTPCPPPIPTVNSWGLLVLGLGLLIGGKINPSSIAN